MCKCSWGWVGGGLLLCWVMGVVPTGIVLGESYVRDVPALEKNIVNRKILVLIVNSHQLCCTDQCLEVQWNLS